MGVILGSKARENVWKSSADWLAERSAQETTLAPLKVPRRAKVTAVVKAKAPTAKAVAMPKAAALPKPAAQKNVNNKAAPSKAGSPARVRKAAANPT